MPSFVGKLPGSVLSGPIRSKRHNGSVGFGGSLGRQASVTVTALATLATQNLVVVDSDAQLGDVISVSPNASPEAGLDIGTAWVSAEGQITIKLRNGGGVALTGGVVVLNYTISR